ncbi:hypothetical protein FSP39_024917 [Pinctada imbricata]|uniref:Uncharacterized protein n=1 Tax=Pinctada imbricata TaxID=66713 RepID=A0AA89C3C0_PINIB|nr:hypothetical protein FSP39_024917 [Pinctada imbricata]
MKNGPILSIYIVCLILIFLLMFAAGIVAALFQGQLESTTKTNMQSAIKNNYGNNIASSSENKRITESWDFFQNRLQCCAVEDYGYTLYRQSHWFSQTNPNVRIQVTGVQSVYNQNPSYNTGTNYNTNYGYHNPDHVVQFIPESCCKNQGTFKTGDWKRFCQSNKFGPPAIVGQRHNNYAMNFKGCYTAAKEFVKDSGAIIIALGFLFAALLVLALVLSIAFWLLLRKTPRHHPVARNDYPVAKEMQNL